MFSGLLALCPQDPAILPLPPTPPAVTTKNALSSGRSKSPSVENSSSPTSPGLLPSGDGYMVVSTNQHEAFTS